MTRCDVDSRPCWPSAASRPPSCRRRDEAAKAKAAEAAAKARVAGQGGRLQAVQGAGPGRGPLQGAPSGCGQTAAAVRPRGPCGQAAGRHSRHRLARRRPPVAAVAVRRPPSRLAPTRALTLARRPRQKPLESSGAHSPAGTATGPPSVRAESGSMTPADRRGGEEVGRARAPRPATRLAFSFAVALWHDPSRPDRGPRAAHPRASRIVDEHGERSSSPSRPRRPDRLRRQARAGDADDPGRASRAGWCWATCATSGWWTAWARWSRSPSTGT